MKDTLIIPAILQKTTHEIIKQIRDFCGDAGIGRVTFPAGASAEKDQRIA
jgi:hypothetical protein